MLLGGKSLKSFEITFLRDKQTFSYRSEVHKRNGIISGISLKTDSRDSYSGNENKILAVVVVR